jgi:flagellar L-ring protein precursor FlgH
MRDANKVISLAMALSLVLLLTSCGVLRRAQAPDYAATWPDVPQPAKPASGAIYAEGRGLALWSNATAHAVGDTLTVRLAERTNASKSSSTTTSKTSSAELAGPTVLGRPVTASGTPILEGALETESSFEGAGDSRQSNRLDGEITVTVAQRLANGNLLVRGQKWIAINQGREFVRLQGIVRPIDIGPDNSVPSWRIADAYIAYGGQGTLANANAPGWLYRFFNSPKTPF